MPDLLIATHNPGKLREYRELLAAVPARLLYLPDVGVISEPEESGGTYADNARIKAAYYARRSGLLTLADDSGLEVDALGGEPGVRSARYAGAGASDRQRYELLLSRLDGVPWEQRTARFQCAIAIAKSSGQVWNVQGSCEGVIGFEPRGKHGFGYDPVFFFPELGATMAELAPEVKNQVSHRARATQQAVPLLVSLLEGASAG